MDDSSRGLEPQSVNVSSSFSAQSDSFATMAITQDLSQYLSHLMVGET